MNIDGGVGGGLGGNNDEMGEVSEGSDAFRQLDYCFLFNNHLKFNERDDFVLDDSKITGADF